MMTWLSLGLLMLVAGATANTLNNQSPVCEVGEWGAWGECPSAPSCRQDTSSRQVLSYGMQPTEWDAGRVHMNILRKEKQRQWKEMHACKADDTCADFTPHKAIADSLCVDGFADIYPCRNIDLLAFMNFDDLGNTRFDPELTGNDIWGWTDPETGHEYALMGLSTGTSFVRVTDPVNPVTLAFMETQTYNSLWHDIKVINNYAYIVSEASDHGLQAFDLTRLRNMDSFEVVLPDWHYDGFGNAHNIVANEETGYLYAVGATFGFGYDLCGGGLHMVDVNDPLNPRFAGCYGGDGYVHDAECIVYRGPDVQYFEHEICFCYNEDSFTIVDVTDHSNPSIVSKTGYINVMYTHQGWISSNHEVVLLDDEWDEMFVPGITKTQTYMWDVRSLRAPFLHSIFESTETSVDHNLYIVDDLVYQSNYEAGLRILHMDVDAMTLAEVGYIDVLPQSTTLRFQGTWSNYPFFESGNIIVSSIDYGLFIVRPRYEAIRDEINSSSYVTEQTRFREIINYQQGAMCPPVMQSRTCQASGC